MRQLLLLAEGVDLIVDVVECALQTVIGLQCARRSEIEFANANRH